MFFKDEGLNRPSDLVVAGRRMYVADSGNARILVKDLDNPQAPSSVLGQDALNRPTGIHVAADGTLYIADSGAKTVVVMAPDGTVQMTIGEPDSPLFGADAMW